MFPVSMIPVSMTRPIARRNCLSRRHASGAPVTSVDTEPSWLATVLRATTLSMVLSAALIGSGDVLARERGTVTPVTTGTGTGTGASAAPAQFVRALGGISEYRLPNGLQVLLFPDTAQSTTTVNITYHVGSRHESPGEYGMAHLLEHLLFKGTPTHRAISDAFARRGVRFNGNTNVDRTSYFASFNADPATLEFVLALEADRMVNSVVAKADLDTEMTVVRNEYENGENDPFEVLSQRVDAVSYDWHNYGHSTIGPKSDIENVPIERLRAFYKRFYRPDNATLLVAGRFDPKTTLAQVARRFGAIRTPPGRVPRPYTVEPAQDGERSVVVRRVGGQPMLLARYHIPALAHPDAAPLLVLGQMLSEEPSGQLYRDLVESRLALNAGLFGLGQVDPGQMSAVAVLPPDADVAQVEARLLDIVEGRTSQPFDDSELARVRDQALVVYREQMKHPEALIQQLSNVVASDWRLPFQLMEDIPKVTLADVERVRKAYLRPANRTLGRYLPAAAAERVDIPAAPPLAQRLADLKGPPEVEAGERLDPTPEALARRTAIRRLPSGIVREQLVKRTRGESVRLQMRLRWGERDETFRHHGTAVVATLMGEGSANVTKQQLRDRLVALKADMQINSGDQGMTLDIAAERDTLLETLALAADLMRHPSLPPDAFDRWRQAALAGLEGQRENLETLRRMAVRAHYNQARGVTQGSPDYLRSVDEDIAQVQATTLEDVRAFHRDYWSANDASVAVVGAVPEGLDAAIERLFGDWKKPSAPAYVRHVARADRIPPARFDAIAADKTGAEMAMRLDLALNARDADYLPLALATHILGGGLESRLSVRVRERAGLSYGVGAALWAPRFGDDADVRIDGSFAPQNREQMLALVRDELRRMTADGITAAELARAKKDVLEGLRQMRADDGALADELLRQHEESEDWSAVAAREAALAGLTVAQVNAAWRKHIALDGFVTSTVGDFKAP